MTFDQIQLPKFYSNECLYFCYYLSQNLAGKSSGNLIYSPYSVAVALALACQGARGPTFEEMRTKMHLTGDQSAIAELFSTSQTELTKNIGKATLNVANKVYLKEGWTLKPEFQEVAVKKFNSEAESINFANSVPAAANINGWVEGKTNNKIKDLIKSDSLDQDTRLVLVNAIYFKGNWQHQFKKEATRKEPFWTSEDKSVDVDMMHIKEDFKYGAFENLDATALELPYNDSDISFLILLPNKRTGLKDLEAKLKDVNLAELTNNMYKSEVEVSMPRFRTEYEVEMKDTLKEVCVAFSRRRCNTIHFHQNQLINPILFALSVGLQKDV